VTHTDHELPLSVLRMSLRRRTPKRGAAPGPGSSGATGLADAVLRLDGVAVALRGVRA